MKSEIYMPDTFLYFAYSVNLLRFRVKMFNPTAEFVSIARLDVCERFIKLFTDKFKNRYHSLYQALSTLKSCRTPTISEGGC